MRPPGSPRTGDLAGFIERPRGSAPRERDHRGGDHPVPSRTRQLSPPSPRVLQREAAGGQGVALAEGAFLCARRGGVAAPAARTARRERPAGGMLPLRAPFASWAAGPRIRHLRRLRLSVWPSSRRRCGVRAEEPRRELLRGSFRVKGGKIDLMVLAAQRRRRARSGNLPPCEPFLRYEVERCLPDASLVLIQNEFAVSTVGYVGGFGCYLIVYET